jgi:hypothetical protein
MPLFYKCLQACGPPLRVVLIGLPWENPKEWRFSTEHGAWLASETRLMGLDVVNSLGAELIQATYPTLMPASET